MAIFGGQKGPKPSVPGADAPKQPKHTLVSNTFRNTRQILFFTLFVVWNVCNVCELGLVSQQIHKYGRDVSDWPGKEYQNAMGLALFSCVISMLFGIFHFAASLFMFLPIFLAHGVWWGTVAGIIYNTPFGHGLKCGLPIERIPANYRPFISQCTRVTAIGAFAWTMFGLSTLGFFLTFFSRYNLKVVRNVVYDLEMTDEQKEDRGLLKKAEEGENH